MEHTSRMMQMAMEGEKEYTQEQLVAVLAKDPLWRTHPAYKDVDIRGVVAPNLTTGQALVKLKERLVQKIKKMHPVDQMAEHASIGSVTVGPGKFIYEVGGKEARAEIASGYPVFDLPNAGHIAMDAHMTDIIMYSVRKTRTGIEQTSTAASRSFGLDAVDLTYGQDIVGSGMVEQRGKKYEEFKAHPNLSSVIMANYCTKIKPERTEVIEPRHAAALQKKYPLAPRGEVRRVTSFVPPTIKVKGDDHMWKIIAKHRGFRGNDEKNLSVLTAGYYLYSMPRDIEKIFWMVSDILYGVSKAVFPKGTVPVVTVDALTPEFTRRVALSLVANNVSVIILGDKTYAPYNSGKVGIYTHRDVKGIRYLTEKLGAPPTIAKDQVQHSVPDAQIEEYAKSIVNAKGAYYMRHIYLRKVWEKYGQYVHPSTHVHAAHALLLSWSVRKSEFSEYYQRAIDANFFKTYFPICRATFFLSDSMRQNSLENGIQIVREIAAQRVGQEDDEIMYKEIKVVKNAPFPDFREAPGMARVAEASLAQSVEPEPVQIVVSDEEELAQRPAVTTATTVSDDADDDLIVPQFNPWVKKNA